MTRYHPYTLVEVSALLSWCAFWMSMPLVADLARDADVGDARAWLRAELASDRHEVAAMSAADVGQAAVDTVLAPGLFARSMVHACVYAINHAEMGATSTWSLFERPLTAECWRPRDDVQASVLSALTLGLFATPYASLPSDPLLVAVVTLQALPLAVDPAVAIAEVAR